MNDPLIKEYQQNVQEAQRMAENSATDRDRAAWLRIAQQWLRMLRLLRPNESVQVDQSSWPDAKDNDSKSSH